MLPVGEDGMIIGGSLGADPIKVNKELLQAIEQSNRSFEEIMDFLRADDLTSKSRPGSYRELIFQEVHN